jgi:hypothetical protein
MFGSQWQVSQAFSENFLPFLMFAGNSIAVLFSVLHKTRANYLARPVFCFTLTAFWICLIMACFQRAWLTMSGHGHSQKNYFRSQI